MLCNRAFARPCQLWHRACACESVPSGTRPRCSFTSTRWLNHRQLAWCGRPGSNRHRPFGPRDFRTDYGFRRRAWRSAARRRVCGLDYTFTLARPRLRCRPSSLYTFPCAFAPGLGSGLPCDRFPRIWAVLHLGFPRGHSSVQVPCVYQFRHARTGAQSINQGFVRQRKSSSMLIVATARGLPACPLSAAGFRVRSQQAGQRPARARRGTGSGSAGPTPGSTGAKLKFRLAASDGYTPASTRSKCARTAAWHSHDACSRRARSRMVIRPFRPALGGIQLTDVEPQRRARNLHHRPPGHNELRSSSPKFDRRWLIISRPPTSNCKASRVPRRKKYGGRGWPDRRKWTTARIDQLTRDQVWPPQTSPPNAQPSTRSVSPLLSEMLAE